MRIYSLGHSTRTGEEFVNLLKKYGIKTLVDIRTIPQSRRNSQFNKDVLSIFLKSADIDYVHVKGLGGLRHPSKDSRNLGWKNLSFRGYADHMQSEEFGSAMRDFVNLANVSSVGIMCAEAVPWRCHRRLVGDALLLRGIRVIDIISETKTQEHALTSWAKVEGMKITYPRQD